ncbi:MAG: hypothetical protein AAB552_03265 [Patescibacteria group bacterium]
MEFSKVSEDMRVRTVGALGDSDGMLIKQEHLDARQPNKDGQVLGQVPGHGGDVWWVAHDDGTTGAYALNELNSIFIKHTKVSPLYLCPKGCEDNVFHRYGTCQSIQFLSETGEEFDRVAHDFAPKEGGVIRCCKCNAPAVIKKKIVTVTEEVTDE